MNGKLLFLEMSVAVGLILVMWGIYDIKKEK